MHSKLEVFGGRGLVLTLIGVLNGPIPIAFTACTLILKNVNVIHGSTIYLKKKNLQIIYYLRLLLPFIVDLQKNRFYTIFYLSSTKHTDNRKCC